MKKLLILLVLLPVACTSLDPAPYEGSLRSLEVRAVYPEGYEAYLRAGVAVTLSDRYSSNRYTAATDDSGTCRFLVAAGHYRLSILDRAASDAVFNGAVQQVDLMRGDRSLDVGLVYTRPGAIVIREIYTGGCQVDPPATGSYKRDKYFILHNNSFEPVYLDGLCLGMVAPYNSKANNPWTSLGAEGDLIFRDYAAVPDCVWRFRGSGADLKLEPGEDAVVAFWGVDHTQTYSQSVDLDREGYFVLYDGDLYPGTKTAPTPPPGGNIDPSHYLEVVKKTGKSGENGANTYVISDLSPAVILYRAPEGVDLDAYLADEAASSIQYNSILYTKIPWEWIVDGVETSDLTGSVNNRRLRTDVDAGSFGFSGTSQGHTVHRRLDEEATAAAGFDIYLDTNNSTEDFYERETQSLRESL